MSFEKYIMLVIFCTLFLSIIIELCCSIRAKKKNTVEDKPFLPKVETEEPLYPINVFLDEWVNKILNDGIVSIKPSLYTSGEKNPHYKIVETQNYELIYWIENKFYGYCSMGNIIIKRKEEMGSDILIPFHGVGISKSTRVRLYSLEQSFEKLNNK